MIFGHVHRGMWLSTELPPDSDVEDTDTSATPRVEGLLKKYREMETSEILYTATTAAQPLERRSAILALSERGWAADEMPLPEDTGEPSPAVKSALLE